MALISKLSAIGDAIRAKTGKSELMTLEQMVTEITSIHTGGSSEAFGLRLLAQGEVVFDNYTSTSSSTTVKTLGLTHPLFDGSHASFIIGLAVRRGGFVAGQPTYSVSCLSNYKTGAGSASFVSSCSYLDSGGNSDNFVSGYGVFFRSILATSATVGARCSTYITSITGTYDLYVYELK